MTCTAAASFAAFITCLLPLPLRPIEEEFYLDLLPWQWLAGANQNFLITERRRHYLRYAGALSFFEINGPSVYKVGLTGCGLLLWPLSVIPAAKHHKRCVLGLLEYPSGVR